jgi:hypothetical protein
MSSSGELFTATRAAVYWDGVRPAIGGVYFQAFGASVTLPAAGYNYSSDWTSSAGGTCTRWNDN